jgi:PPOX class probable F420-dependent enzyme
VSLPIPEKFHDLFTRPLLCAFTTLNPNGQPHTVPVWCDLDEGHVRVNAPAVTKKARNVQTNPKVSILVMDPQNPGHWIEIQGQVGETRDDAHGAREHIDKLAHKYTGGPYTRDTRDRVMMIIDALKINGN